MPSNRVISGSPVIYFFTVVSLGSTPPIPSESSARSDHGCLLEAEKVTASFAPGEYTPKLMRAPVIVSPLYDADLEVFPPCF